MDVKPIILKGGVFLCTSRCARINPQSTGAWMFHCTSRTSSSLQPPPSKSTDKPPLAIWDLAPYSSQPNHPISQPANALKILCFTMLTRHWRNPRYITNCPGDYVSVPFNQVHVRRAWQQRNLKLDGENFSVQSC